MLPPLTNWDESRIRILVETGPIDDTLRHILQAGVSPYDSLRRVIEAELNGILEDVSVELRAVGRSESDALSASDDGVVEKSVVLVSPGIRHPRFINPLVGVNVIPEDEMKT